MTARNPLRRETLTPLISAIVAFYAMVDADITALAADLARQMRVTYLTTIQQQLNLYKCQKTATGPDEQAQAWITETARARAEGIARTYNRELSNKVQTLYRANPRGNRNYYVKNLEAWTAQRNAYKIPSIALNTMTEARRYAQDRFARENRITGLYVLVGPPPACRICIRIKGLGAVPYEVTQQPLNVLPAHVNCPHKWGQLIPKAIDCENAWTG